MALLFLALVMVLFGALSGEVIPFAVGIVSAITAMTAIRFVSRWVLLVFWCWLTTVVLYLLFQPPLSSLSSTEARVILGMPAPVFWMLFGVWLVPILILPLHFLLRFQDWMDQ
jgi:hypothetical protein